MLLKLIFVYFLLGCACGSYTYSPYYGGWGGRSFTQFCPSGDYVDRMQLRTGRLVDAVRVHCARSGWKRWAGGNGGGLRTIAATPFSPEFCGFGVRTGRLVDRLCLRDPSGHEQCHGGNGGRWNTQNYCYQRQASTKVLVGIRGRSGRLVDQIQFVFEDKTSCDPNQNDWSCCSAAAPCGDGQGDCDNDSHCEGELICKHNVGRQHGAQSSGFDVCGHPENVGRLLQEEEEEEVPEAEGCHVFDDQDDCEDGESCVFFVPPEEMFDTLADQGRLFACWNANECAADEAGQTTCA